MVIFPSYVSLPEGIWMFQQIEPLSSQRAAFSHALIAALKVITSSLSRSARSAFAADSSCNAHCHWEDFSQALMAALKVMMSTFWESPTGCISSNLRAVSHCAPRSHELMAALRMMRFGPNAAQSANSARKCRHKRHCPPFWHELIMVLQQTTSTCIFRWWPRLRSFKVAFQRESWFWSMAPAELYAMISCFVVSCPKKHRNTSTGSSFKFKDIPDTYVYIYYIYMYIIHTQ